MGSSFSCNTGCANKCSKDPKAGSRTGEGEDFDFPGAAPEKVEETIQPDAWDISKLKNDWEEPDQDTVTSPGASADVDKGLPTLQENEASGGALKAADLPLDAGGVNLSESPAQANQEAAAKPAPKSPFDPNQIEPEKRISWKRAVKKALLAKNMGAKIAIENKIGKKLTGWFRDVALELQKGVAASGRSKEHGNFEAPEHELFKRCRTACGFTEVRYFSTMGLQDGLTEPNLALIGNEDAAGKSGSFFFLSPDQQLIAKSCTSEDWKQLLRILPAYCEHFEAARAKATSRGGEGAQASRLKLAAGTKSGLSGQAESEGFVRGFTDTLLPRFLGLYSLSLPGADPKDEPVRVLVMANTFGGSMTINRRYDLKGSTHGRKASKKECAKKAPIYKDIDWVAVEPALRLTTANRESLLNAIKVDLAFLAKEGLMDYSLLVGVHDIAKGASSVYEAMNVVTVRDSTRHTYIGIIDVLTPYKMKKRAETLCLGTVVCGRDVSCQHPKVYARRFYKFTDEHIFTELKS